MTSGGGKAEWLAYYLLDPAASGLILSISQDISKTIVRVAKVKSGQWFTFVY